MIPSHSPDLPLLLGCPVWNCDRWGGAVYPVGTPKRERLSWYTRMFNTVEGGSCFYAIPEMQSVHRWAQDSAPGFRFCLKFPREISHERGLEGAQVSTERFLRVLYVLAEADRLGPSFLQLGPDFGPDRLHILESYLNNLPRDLAWAVEVRHKDWFDSASNEESLDGLLRGLGIDKVLFDSRPLYQLPAEDEIEKVSQTRKPRTPHRRTVTGPQPMLRLVGRNRVELVDRFLDEWVPVIGDWIRDGLRPVVFTHAPDDAVAPDLARRLWERLAAGISTDPSDLPSLPSHPKQLGFAFD